MEEKPQTQSQEPTQPEPPKRQWYARRPVITFAIGLLVAFALVAAFHIIRNSLSTENKISCHQPTTQNTQLPYCVYYKGGKLLIGTNNDRGLSYTIPYELKEISVSWENNTDALTVTMPGTKLVIQASEYVDKR